MKTTSFSWAAFALIAAVAACTPQSPQNGSTTTTTTGTSTSGTTGTQTPTVDAKLMHDGYRYMGFNRVGDLTYSYSELEGTPGTLGTQAIEVGEVTPEKAVYKVNRAGALSTLGSESYEVRPDGVYLIQMALGQIEKPMLSIPAEVKVGSKWTSELVTTGPGGTPGNFVINHVAEKEEEIKVKAGTFQTILVSGNGKMTGKDGTQTVLYKTWYAKDIGHVKMRIEVSDGKGKTKKSTLELASLDSKPETPAPATTHTD